MTRLKPYWALALTALLPALLLSCAGKPFTNTFAPAVGDKRQVQLNTAINIKMAVMGMNINQSQSQAMALTLEVTEVDPDGNVMLQATVDDLTADQTMPKLPGMDLGNAMADMLKEAKAALAEAKGEQFSLKVGPAGEIILSRDLMDLADRIKRKSKASSGNQMMVNAAIDQALDDKVVEETVGTMFECYRNMATKTGDTWSVTREVNAGLPMSVTSTYTLGEVTDTNYGVSEAMVITGSGAPNLPGMPEGLPMEMNIDMNGSGTATHAVDRKSTWLTDYRAEFSMTGKMNMSGIPGAGNMAMDMTLSGTTTIAVTPL